jgi:autotransporter-associated beta strand protein
MNMRPRLIPPPRLFLPTAALAWLSLLPVQANDWTTTEGNWNEASNWNGGIPNNAAGWAIGNIGNGGTATINAAVPTVSEAWAGNNGVAGHILVAAGGTLNVDNWLVVGRNGDAGNTPLSTLTVADGLLNKRGDGFIIGDSVNGKGQMFVTGSGQVHVSGGWNGIGNGTGKGWLTLQDNAIYTLDAQDWNVGDWGTARGHAFIKDNATLNASRFWIGKWDDTVGAVWQTGGAVVGKGANANEWCLGGEGSGSPNAFGFYSLAGGSLTCPYNFQVGRYGKGVLYQSGGTNLQSGWCDTARYAGSLGITWISGGLFQHTGTATRYMVGETGRGEVTLSGTGILETAAPLMMANGTAFLNLNGGTLVVPEIGKWGGSASLSFNGGTVRAKVSNANFISTLMSDARIYSGHAIFDTAGYDIAISQPLLDGAGQGVLSIEIVDGGAGYVAPPIVQITGDGAGAQAVAEINREAGTLARVLITCAGRDYSAASVELIGGGASTPATLGSPVVGQVLGGGVIKQGAGKLTLSGANQYTGPTTVQAGSLAVTTDATGMGSYSVASGAGLGVKCSLAGAQLNVSSLTFEGSSATLEFDLGNFGNPLTSPIQVAGTLAVSGTVTVNIADSLPLIGQFPLLQYGNRSGTGTFALGTLPAGVQAILVNNAAAKSVDLKITSIGLPRWEGLVSDVWDIDLTSNWVELSTGQPSKYKDGAPAIFNDSAAGTTTVNLTATVQPNGVVVDNSTLDYTITGPGRISGSAGLTKQGSATLTLANTGGNDYAGPTTITAGRVVVSGLANGGLPSAIGKSSASPTNLVLSSGRLTYTGAPVIIDRGYSILTPNASIETVGDLGIGGLTTASTGSGFVKAGPGVLSYVGPGTKVLGAGATPSYNVAAGTALFDGTGGGQVNQTLGEFWVGGTPDAGAALILSNTTFNVESWFAIGRGNGTLGNVSSATLYDAALRTGNFSMGYDAGIPNNLGRSVLTLNGHSSLTNNGDMNLGESGGSVSEIILKDNAALYSGWRVHVGWHTGGTGSLTLANNSSMNVNAWMSFGHEGGTGTLTVKDQANLRVLWDLNITDVGLGDASMIIQDNAQVSFGGCYVGKGVGSSGSVNQSGGAILGRADGNDMHIGFHGPGTWNLTGGSIQTDNQWFVVGRYIDGPGLFNVSAGSVRHVPANSWKLFRVGEDGVGVLNISGSGSVESSGDTITLGSNATGDGTINLNGGSLQARRIIGVNGVSTLNLNGGVLRVGASPNPDFMTGLTSANVLAGGAVIDTGTETVGISQSLLAGPGTGGLTKLGTGTLHLNGANTYTGTTRVTTGTVGGVGSISGPVLVTAGGALAPGVGIGTLTLQSSLTLEGTTVMEISKNNGIASDLVVVSGNVAFGGLLKVMLNSTNALAVDDTFNLFDWGTRSGTFASMSLPAGYTWDTTKLTVDGTLRVAAVAPASPTLGTPIVVGGDLILIGSGGTPGGTYTWLSATQVEAPAVEWAPYISGTFDSAGSFSNAIPVLTTEGKRFFKLRLP